MGCWNYRVQRRHDGTEPYYIIVEAHYKNRGDKSPNQWTEEPAAPQSETFEGLVKEMAQFMTALTKPCIDEKGADCEPATIAADMLQNWLNEVADTEGSA